MSCNKKCYEDLDGYCVAEIMCHSPELATDECPYYCEDAEDRCAHCSDCTERMEDWQ